MATTSLKTIEVFFENAIDTYEHQDKMLDLVDFIQPDGADLQNSGNVIWRPAQQHAPIIPGFDISSMETDIIEEGYPAILGVPQNDLVRQRIDDLRDMGFWERRGIQSGLRQVTELNKQIALEIVNRGSLYYEHSIGASPSGYNAIAVGQAILNERQKLESDQRYCLLNDRDTLLFAGDLAARQTLQGRPEMTWKTGQIGQNIAGFDVMTASFLPNNTIGAATTLAADIEGKPEAGTVVADNMVTNIDYRKGTATLTSDAGFTPGQHFTIDGTNSLGLADKTNTNQLMTYVVTAQLGGNVIEFFPKNISANDSPALNSLELAYANTDIQPLSAETVTGIHTEATNKTNLFWCKSSIEVIGGEVPMNLMTQFGGMKTISHKMKNGQTMYLIYDGDILTLDFRYRLFTWYGITNKDPSANGTWVTIA